MTAIGAPSAVLLDGFQDAPVSLHHDRRVGPAETLRALAPLLAGFGITRLGDLGGLDKLDVPVAFAARPNSFSLSVSLGKGIDRDAAFASAAMEAVETAVAERLPTHRLRASIDELRGRGEPILDLARIARCQPGRLPSHIPLDWVEGRGLVAGERILVPWALVGLDHRVEPEGYHDAFEIASDGLASGNSTAEAVFHGICELIERDAYALHELAPAGSAPGRPPRAGEVADAAAGNLLAAIANAGLGLELVDMTTDIGVPAYTAMLSRADGEDAHPFTWSSVCGGCGCHPRREKAVLRALTEALQARAALIAGARDDLPSLHYRPLGGERGPAVARRSPAPEAALPPAAEEPGTAGGFDDATLSSVGAGILHLLSRLAAAGIDRVVVVRLATGSDAISVVRVIIPDLQVPLHGERTQVTRRGLRQALKFAR